MNCEDFKTIVSELAEGRPMEATRRVTGMSHAATCIKCAQELSDAQMLSGGLRIAVSAETEAAPVRVKQTLLAAFAAQQKEMGAAPVNMVSTWRKLRWLSVAAVAAAAVLLLALILPALLRVSPPEPPKQTVKVREEMPLPSDPKPKKDRESSTPKAKPFIAKTNPPKRTPVLPRRTRPSAKAENESTAKNVGNEYFPLTYLANSTAMESGMVVRVQLTRSALISLGLPMNNERTNGLVKADLVLGDDGVARAIRLVQ